MSRQIKILERQTEKMLQKTTIIVNQAKKLYKEQQKLEKKYLKLIPDGHDQFWNQVFDE